MLAIKDIAAENNVVFPKRVIEFLSNINAAETQFPGAHIFCACPDDYPNLRWHYPQSPILPTHPIPPTKIAFYKEYIPKPHKTDGACWSWQFLVENQGVADWKAIYSSEDSEVNVLFCLDDEEPKLLGTWEQFLSEPY